MRGADMENGTERAEDSKPENGTEQAEDSKPENDEPLTWEKQKNQEYKQRIMKYQKPFAIGFLILFVGTVVLNLADVDIEKEVSLLGYNISIRSSLMFFWIIAFTLYLSQVVPIMMLMLMNKIILLIKESRAEKDLAGTSEEITTSTRVVGQDQKEEGVISDDSGLDTVDGSADASLDNGDGSDSDSGGLDTSDGSDSGGLDTSDGSDSGGPDTSDGSDSEGPEKGKGEVVDPDEKEGGEAGNEKEEEKKGKAALLPWMASLRKDGLTEEETTTLEVEQLIYSFFRYIILIVGFAYAFLALGLDLENKVEVLGSDITAGNILNMILTILITAVFVVYFLPTVMNIIVNVFLSIFSKRKSTTEERLKQMRDEIDKVRPGLNKTILFLIILFAALGTMNHIDCSVESDPNGSSGYYDSQTGEWIETSSGSGEQSDLCNYLDSAKILITSLIILFAALLLTTITPLFIYMISTSPGDVRKSSLYKAGMYINYLILIIASFIILNVVGLDLGTSISLGENEITLWSMVSAIVVLILFNIIGKLVIAVLKDTALNPEQMEEHASVVMEKLIHTVIILVGIAVAMGTLGIDIFAIATGLGLIGFALAFGMQETIANIVGGIVLAIEKPFKIGDRIRVEDDWGDVIDIGMRSTKIRTTKNEIVVIPNSLMVTREVWNFTKDTPVLANVIPIGISYDSDPVKAERIIIEVAQQHPEVIDNPPVHVRMVDYAESSVNLELWAWIANARKREIVRSDLLKSIKERFNAEGISIPFPHRTLTFKKEAGDEIAEAMRKKM